MLWGLLSFKQHLLFGRSKSKPPGRRNQAESASAGWRWTCQRYTNPREAEIRLKVLRRGLAVDMPEQGWKVFRRVWRWTSPSGVWRWTWQKSGMCLWAWMSTPKEAGFGGGHARANPREAEIWHVHFEPDFSLISASRGFALACPPPNPAEALSAWFLLPGGLLWHVHLQTLPKHFQPDFFFAGVCSGMSTPKPRRSTFSLISSSRGLALACPPRNPDEALSPIPRLETSPSHTCFEPDYGLHLGLRIRLFGASDIRIPGLRIKVRPAGIWNSLDNCSDFVQGWLENSDRNMYSPVSSDMVGCLILSYMEVNMLLCRDQSIKY